MCVHGGIGSNVNKLSDISNIRRPAQVVHDIKHIEEQILMDLLWSEYSDEVDDVAINEERDLKKTGSILKFGKDMLSKFIYDNNLMMMITSHQFIQEGVKSFADQKLLVVYSVTNFMDKYANFGGMIHINKNSTKIDPKLLELNKNESRKNFKTNIRNTSPIKK